MAAGKNYKTLIVWLRRDLRVHDNAALHALALSLLLLTAGMAGAAPTPLPAPAPALPAGPEVTVPFTTIPGGLMLLRAHLTGAQGKEADATFLLDTGSSGCQITTDLAGRLGLTPTPALGVDGKPLRYLGRSAQQVVVPLLTLGILRVPSAPFRVISDGALRTALGDQAAGVDGIIGGNFLTAAPTVIDPQYALVGFFAHPLTAADIAATGMSGAVEFPVTEVAGNEGTYACHVVMVNGGKTGEADLVVDTGFNLSAISSQDAARLGLNKRGPRSQIGMMTGKTDVYTATLPSLTLGGGHVASPGAQIRNLQVLYPEGKFPDYAPPAVGMDVLSRFRVLLDFPDRKMYLLPVTRPAAVSPLPPPQAPAK